MIGINMKGLGAICSLLLVGLLAQIKALAFPI